MPQIMCLRYVSCFTVATLFVFLACVGVCPHALAVEDLEPADYEASKSQKDSLSTGTAFFDNAKVRGGLYYFHRNRVRYDVADGRYRKNLDHASGQASMEFLSGLAGDVLGFDFGLFGSTDFRNKGAVDHEMGFVPWRDPWHPKWDRTDTITSASFYKAHLKLKADPVWMKAGYFQPSGPGVLGVNWSFLPGTYRGVEAGANIGGLSLAVAWADQYKAPWYTTPYHFLQRDNTTHVAWLGSLGARYTFEDKSSVEVAYGESEGYMKNAHLKLEKPFAAAGGQFKLGYHLYGMADSCDDKNSVNNHFDGIATQHYAFSRFERDLWRFQLEGLYTKAPQDTAVQLGYFAYRMTVPTGSSKGAYGAWWDARSDWNADEEKAVFAGVWRKLDDVLPFEGMEAGISAAHGFDGRGYGVSERFSESAVNFDLGYTHKQKDWFEGAWAKLHYTEYRNHTGKPSWSGYKNAFQDERDIKFLVCIPLGT